MYRVLLSTTGKAYAVECDIDNSEFLDELEYLVNNGDIILFCEDLDDLEDALGDEYEIEEVYEE